MEKESELKYTLHLLNGLTEEIFDEILQVYYDFVDKKNTTIFSDSVLSFFKDNLLHNPVTASTILSFFQNSLKSSEEYTNVIQNMYKEILVTKVTDVTKTDEFISLLSLFRLDDEFLQNFSENILGKISEDQFRQHKKELLINLITLDRPKMLTDLANRFNKISNFKSHEFTFSADYMLTLCYEHNQHWLLKALEAYKFQLEDVKRVNFEMNKFTKQLLMLITIDIVNCIETSDLSRVFIQLENILSILNSYSSTDKQLEFYITEIFRAFNVLKFCFENSNCKTICMSYFNQSLIQSALSIISQYCVLSNIDRYKMSRLLSINNDTLFKLKVLNGEGGGDAGKSSHWDITVYNSYCIITMILDFIVQSNSSPNEETNVLDEIKLLILGLNPVAYQIETIENVYACLFLRYEYYSCNEYDQMCNAHSESSYFVSEKTVKCPHVKNNSNVGFICNAQTTQSILTTLKEIICKIENEIGSEELTENFTRLKYIAKLVNDSLWKLQLVSNLSPDQSSVAPLKICLDYADFGDSSEDDEAEKDVRISRKKPRLKKRNSNTKSDNEPVGSSQMSSSIDGPWWVSRDTDFTSLLLASPSSLVALALHHNHFTKANQIIEMYDLSDTEIAAEVNFIEQYKQLVIKINNIIFPDTEQSYPIKELTSFSLIPAGVVSLVEGFLASQRSPNYHEVVELARRYPDLQLYDPRNSNLINAIDLLLSTGVKCEVTYGLINIIEKKLTDVQIPREIGTKKNNYIQFIKDAISIMFEIFGKCETTSPMYVDNMCSVVSDCRIPLKHKDFTNLKQYSTELTKYYEDLSETLNSKSPKEENFNFQKCHQTYMNVVSISDKDLCSILETYPSLKKKPRTHYLRACYIYVKNISNMETDSDKQLSPDFQLDRTYFCVMNKHLNNLIGELIYEKASPITSLEPICKKLSINLVHKLLLNFCPPIQVKNVQTEPNEDSFNSLLQMVYAFHDTEEEMFIEHTENFCPLPRPLDTAATSYIVLHNWVIANLIQKVHSASQNSQMQQSVDFRTKFLNNYMELERFDNLKVMFGGNKTITSLQSCINLNDLFKFMMKLVNSGKLVQCLQIIDSLSEGQLLQNSNLMNLRDFILFKLALNSRIENSWKYTYHLKCTELRIDLVLNNLSSWPAEGALEVLDVLRYNRDIRSIDDTVVTKCKNWLKCIPVYQQIAETSSMGGWFDVYEKSIDVPKEVLEILMDNQQFKLCLQWTNFHDISNNMKCLIISSLLRQLFEYTSQTNAQEIRTLLKELPIPQAVDLVHKNVSKIHNLEILQEIMIFINENSSNSKLLENIKIGLLIMSEIELNVRNLFWDIIDKPLLIIEQYLMNAKLELLASIISKISPSLINDPAGDNLYFNIKVIDSIIISRNSVDALLRVYAEKALDMRCVSKVGMPAPRKINEDYLLQSIDSINLMGTNGPFVMPEQVPSKEQWVRDEQAERCMLCRLAIFSMLIRRHHCRRCGRLVCHTCSRHRMQVASYAEGVHVRVCDDCYTQTALSKLSADGDKATLLSSDGSGCDSSVASMEWCLGVDANRNNQVRREFSYEFTPSVTLCLTIMKMHSLNLDYPRFLLDRSEEMARALSTGGAAPRLLLRARRALLLAASELYSRFPTEDSGSAAGAGAQAEAGAAHAARRLAHTASLALLVKHGCQHLAPPDGAMPGQYVRRLLEAEKWELALEIATKSGVPRNSVLAAWGKACLKAGCFQRAREKLAHCFRSSITVQNINVEPPPEDCEFGKEANESSPFTGKSVLSKLRSSSRWSSTSSLQSEGLRPKQNPPLLNEIISILENVNFPIKTEQRNKAEQMQIMNENKSGTRGSKLAQEPALTITHAFASVERIKLGDYSHLYVTNSPKKVKTLGLPQTLLRRQSSMTEPKNNDPVNKLDPYFFNECVYYLTNYGSHVGNIAFYLKNGTVADVLKYCRDNTVEKEVFTEAVYLECLKNNRVAELIKCMQEMDSTWEMWSDYLTHTCRTLESSGQLSALYWLQTATGEQARAGATCARMYCASAVCARVYATLLQRQHYLVSARAHLMQCVPTTTTATTSTQHKNIPPNSHQLRMDSATLEKHINTVSRQIEVAKFLAQCEQNNRINERIMSDIFPTDPPRQETDMIKPLTMFGTLADKTKLATLILVCGENVLEGYSLAHKIMDDNKVDAWRVYSVCARFLICNNRFNEVRDLCCRIRETSAPSSSCQALSDSVLETGVGALVRHCDARGQLFDEQAELLIEDIKNIAVKIACYMECRILASAYILAVKHGRLNDLRRILREAERLGQDQVRHACTKRLAAHKML